MGNVCIFVYLYIPKTEIYGYLIGYTRRYLFVGGIGGVFFADLAGAAGGVLALWLLHFTGYAEFTVTELVVWGLLVVLAQAMDYVTPCWGLSIAEGPSGELGMCRGNRGRHIRVSALGNLAGSFRGGFRWGTFGRQGVRRCVEG